MQPLHLRALQLRLRLHSRQVRLHSLSGGEEGREFPQTWFRALNPRTW
jgi:hypothetical protein